MNENTKEIFEKLKNNGKKKSKANIVFLIIMAISLVMSCFITVAQPVGMAGIVVFSCVTVVFLIKLLAGASSGSSLKAGLKMMEQTGSIQYINEVFAGNGKKVEKAFFCEHVLYVPGALVLAYTDIGNVIRFKGDFLFYAGAKQKAIRVPGNKVKKSDLEYLINNYNIKSER